MNIFKSPKKQLYCSGDAVWINDIKLVRKFNKECGKKFNFFGRVMYYNENSGKYTVEFRTCDNSTVTFKIDPDALSSPNQFNDNTIGYYMFNYDLDAVLDYQEFTKSKAWYKREREKNRNEGIMPIDTVDGNKKGK